MINNWVKSTHSGGCGHCVEAGHAPGLVALRDTKNRDQGMITMSRDTFARLISAVR